MRQHTIFTLQSPYRDDFRVRAFSFGSGEREFAIVGSMRGDELQQQYIAARMVSLLSKAEAEGLICPGSGITVIPTVNPFSINIEKRFWALDGTDINRMFPGYDRGETTQRIAASLFDHLQRYRHGVQLASYYLPGDFLPHVRIIHTSVSGVLIDEAKKFGLPYVVVKEPQPIDTVLLNYNWQIWDTHAFSIYAGTTDSIDQQAADMVIDSLFRYMVEMGMILPQDDSPGPGFESVIINEDEAQIVKAPHAGILTDIARPGTRVERGDIIARIMHPLKGSISYEVRAPANGLVFFARNKSITYQNTLLFRIV